MQGVGVLALAALLLAGCSSVPEAVPRPADSTGHVASPTAATVPSVPSGSASVGLAVTSSSRTDLRHFASFTYDTAVTTGLGVDAARAADTVLADFVGMLVDDRAKEDSGSCFEGEETCGSFALTIREQPCADYLCARVDASGLHVGAFSGDSATFMFVFDLGSGRSLRLSDVYGDSLRKPIERAVQDWQRARGYVGGEFPMDVRDITGWAPLEDGIHVWFSTGAIGPEADGVPEVVAPYPGEQQDATLAADLNEEA